MTSHKPTARQTAVWVPEVFLWDIYNELTYNSGCVNITVIRLLLFQNDCDLPGFGSSCASHNLSQISINTDITISVVVIL